MIPDLGDALLDRLRDAFRTARYDADGVLDLLGSSAHAALGRGEPEPARRASAEGGALGTLVRLFLMGSTESRAAVQDALLSLDVDDAVAAGLLVSEGTAVRAGLDIRPHGADEHSWWVISDLDAQQRPSHEPLTPEHVLGVGHASLSLLRATSRSRVGSVLDLGTGCGVQALHASAHADRITATDVSARALALADATFRLNGIAVETVEGDWFAPVAGRRFDLVVCNPPFVVGPPRTDFTYRDSGLTGDDASALVVSEAPSCLVEGGRAHLLASWLHREGEDWRDRVTGWLPDDVDAWFVQRDVADPDLYVGTWLRDAGYDLQTDAGARKAAEWLDWFEHNRVDGVGFGFVTLRRTTTGSPQVVCEDLRHAFDDPLGAESDGWLRRAEWLRTHAAPEDLLGASLVIAPTTVLEQISEPTPDGWSPTVHRLHRTDGPGWRHEVDDLGARLIAGCQGALPLGDLVELLATAHGVEPESMAAEAEPVIRELVRHGMLLPAEWSER